ncbi:hypothetical protein LOCC1_G002310 [Lachnellula occidentalis]|uniref:Peptidase A1 domain-containing protein n=1 Tax=Lachnellula occidentalis TaxID=215460 RepID=A0A8H8UJN2_9HELO|nr:hypothetical protein LOCC1_G002310 [Lachnellula occidentalis]
MRGHLFISFTLALIFLPNSSVAWFGEGRNQQREERANSTSSLSPLVVPPSQYWDGVDGQWSSVALRLGSPAQIVRAIVSTNSPQTFVVLPQGCDTIAIDPVPPNCASGRGGLFNPNASTTWQDQGFYGINGDGVGIESALGYTQYADYGLEDVGLGFSGGGANTPTLKNQTVSGIASVSPIYFGLFGLGTQPVNYSSIGNFSAPSYFSSLKAQNLIPSLSWSYTAGAKYRLKAGQYAQLIFGGYDSSRFAPNSATFNLASDINRDIVVGVQSIVYSSTTQMHLLPTPIYAFIESTDPNFWLPLEACSAFEKAFGISVDNSTGLYLINTTHYTNLKNANPTVTFTLANSLDGGDSVNIQLPFNSFALQASYPFTPNDTYYFPLKKAANETQYTLGRTFLQEAYLTVDYERGNFSVSQCLWNDGAASQVVTISAPSNGTNGSGGSGSEQEAQAVKKQGVSIGAIVGIVVAVLVLLAVGGALLWIFLRRRKRSLIPMELSAVAAPTIVIDHPTGQTPYEEFQNPFSNRGAVRNSFPPDKKTEWEPMPPMPHQVLHHQRSELSTTTEIFQLADRDNREGTYDAEAERMNSTQRATNTPELPASSVLFELEADPVTYAERSRDLLSSPAPTFSSRHTETTLSPTTTGLPVSPQSAAVARGQGRSPAQSVQNEPMSWLAISPTDSSGHGLRAPRAESPHPANQLLPRGGTPSPRSRWFNIREQIPAESPCSRDNSVSHVGNMYRP